MHLADDRVDGREVGARVDRCRDLPLIALTREIRRRRAGGFDRDRVDRAAVELQRGLVAQIERRAVERVVEVRGDQDDARLAFDLRIEVRPGRRLVAEEQLALRGFAGDLERHRRLRRLQAEAFDRLWILVEHALLFESLDRRDQRADGGGVGWHRLRRDDLPVGAGLLQRRRLSGRRGDSHFFDLAGFEAKDFRFDRLRIGEVTFGLDEIGIAAEAERQDEQD